jgi:hypothetical protein
MSRLQHRGERFAEGRYVVSRAEPHEGTPCQMPVVPYPWRYATACIDAAKWFRALLGAHGLLLLLLIF